MPACVNVDLRTFYICKKMLRFINLINGRKQTDVTTKPISFESILHGAPLEVKTHINLRLVSEISSGFVDEQANQGAMKLTAINIGVADVTRKYFTWNGKLYGQNLLNIK